MAGKHTSGLSAAGLRRRFFIALVLMSVIPLLYVGYLYNIHVDVPPDEGMWILVAVLFLLVIVATGALIVRRVFTAVMQITEGAKAVAEGQVQEVEPVEVDDAAEMGELAKSINTIMHRIRDDTDTLQSSRAELQATKSKLMESYAKLEEAIEKLRQVDQMKTDFVANVAHELIHPLATLRGALDLVLANIAQEDPQKKQVLDISRRNMARLIRLVTDILDISRIESGKSELHVQDIDVNEMVQEIVLPLKKLFEDKGIAFTQDLPDAPPTLEADRDRIIQAATNLLINAAKYTHKSGKVVLALSVRDGQMRWDVRDNGPGMSQKDKAKLFDKFSRVTKEKEAGTGLGLCITKDIITLHGGRIWVESKEGEGTTFSFVIPTTHAKGTKAA